MSITQLDAREPEPPLPAGPWRSTLTLMMAYRSTAMPSTRHGTSTIAVTAPPDSDLSFDLPALAVLALPAVGDADVGLALVEPVTVVLEVVVVGDAVVLVVVGGGEVGGGVHAGPTRGLSNSVRSVGGETRTHGTQRWRHR